LNQNLDSYIKNSIFSSLMITNLINELLDQAKLEKSTFELDNEYFNLFEVIIHAFQILKFQAETKNIKLMLQIDQSKPFLFCKIWGDKRRYLQILLNFISNSLKFTKKGGFIKVHLKVLQE
jgi:two-component system sensor histidine kinase/response regulator